MRYFIFIFCLVQFQVQAYDWLNRTVRVDLIVDNNHTDHRLERSASVSNVVAATNGRHPWMVYIIAWTTIPSRASVVCPGALISNNLFLTDTNCVGRTWASPPHSINAYIGSAYWPRNIESLPPTHHGQTFWYIEASPQNSPSIVLVRLVETVNFNPNVQPISLPLYEDFAYEGWSSLKFRYNTANNSTIIQLFSDDAVSIIDNNLCNFDGSTGDHHVCAVGVTRNTGSPWVVYEYRNEGTEYVPVLIAIENTQLFGAPPLYARAARVSVFADWIRALSEED